MIKVIGKESLLDIQKEFNIHRATYYRAKKRGYFCPGYHVKKVSFSREMDTTLAYKISHSVARKYFKNNFLMEDLIQEGVLEIFLKAGEVVSASSYARLASQGMRNYIYSFVGRKCKKRLTRSIDLDNI